MLHLTADDVDRLLPMPAAVDAARATARAVAEGLVQPADRIWHRPAGMPGTIGVMPAHLADDGSDPAIFTTKLVGVFPGAGVQGLIAVQDATTGAPLATVDAGAVTALRTAAHSGLSMDLLAVPDAATAAVLGTGAQGWAHLRAAVAVRPVRSVRLWNRTRARAEALAARASRLPGVEDVSVWDTPHDAARGAAIICCCTDSPTPVLSREDVAPGAHVTAIGAYTPDTRELAADLLARADVLVVDDLEAAAHEAGDVLLAVAERAIDPRDVDGDLPALVVGGVPHRRPGDVTVYKSVGTSAMDAVAVRHLLAAEARDRFAVYGTLAPGAANHDVVGRYGGRWTTGTVAGTRHADGWHGYPGLVLDGGVAVPVHVLDAADPIDWADVERFEGPGYRRRRTTARLADGTTAIANVVVLAEPPTADGAAGRGAG